MNRSTKILWIVNTIFPAPSIALGKPAPILGGWMYGMAAQLGKQHNLELAVATTYDGKELKEMTIDGIVYFLLPNKNNRKYNTKLELLWTKVCSSFQPDVVHIHGTEYKHGLACMLVLPHLVYIISIQGMISVISRYYYSSISFWDILLNITFRDLIRRDTLFHQKKNFIQQGDCEKEYLLKTKHVIGRTNWDKAHSKSINPSVNYYFCNESLRQGFYSAEKWTLEKCEKHTIFLSQASYPIKGLHQVIEAMVLLRSSFPDIKLKIAGNDIVKNSTFTDKVRITGYGKYIRGLLKKYELNNNVLFLGPLDEDKMIESYQNAHVFVCPSSVENSPNSLGEAQLLGVPCIASYVGGIPDMIDHSVTGFLYRFEEVEMLAKHITDIFNNNYISNLSVNEIHAATIRHDQIRNLNRTLDIYKIINE